MILMMMMMNVVCFLFSLSIGSCQKGTCRSRLVADAVPLMKGLADPAEQSIFVQQAPNALDPSYIMTPLSDNTPAYTIAMGKSSLHSTGLVKNGTAVLTTIFGYSDENDINGGGQYIWPGKTSVQNVMSAGGTDVIDVNWINKLYTNHTLPVDTSMHWCFSMEGYTNYTIAKYGVPTVPHLHGGQHETHFDGNPEFFFTPGNTIIGPGWKTVPEGFTTKFAFNNDLEASMLWYHDHALGITRLNVYAGLVGLYILRDSLDSGLEGNPLGLPAGKYEHAYAIQDYMFTEDGDMFYPAFPGDPAYEGFITDEGATLPADKFPGGGPTALAEFFGDFMVVNGKIWPKVDAEPREYRLRFLNACDSRFLVIQFVAVELNSISPTSGESLFYTIVGSDGGLGSPRLTSHPLVIEPGARYDIVIDFGQAPGMRVILRNLASDAPFGGDFGDANAAEDLYPERFTDRIMAFDIENAVTANPVLKLASFPGFSGVDDQNVSNVRHVALLEGKDEFGRLQPILGAKDTTFSERGLFPVYTWSQPPTEIVELGATEEWYIYNFSADAHPIHLHLVNFEIVIDFVFTYQTDGEQVIEMANGKTGVAPRIKSVAWNALKGRGYEYYDEAPKDVVTVKPGDPDLQIGHGTIIRATFPKPGKYVWHCHILSHEDHEMMRIFEVVPSESLYDARYPTVSVPAPIPTTPAPSLTPPSNRGGGGENKFASSSGGGSTPPTSIRASIPTGPTPNHGGGKAGAMRRRRHLDKI